MLNELKNLTPAEIELLIKAPVYVAILSAISDDATVDKYEKADAIKLAHLRTFTSPPLLHDYYKEVDHIFAKTFEEVMATMPRGVDKQTAWLKSELQKLNPVFEKLPAYFSMEIIKSLRSFADHVFRVNNGVLQYLVLPVVLNEIEKKITL
jgi:hypothetical protein